MKVGQLVVLVDEVDGSKQAEKVASWVCATTCSRSVAKRRTLALGPGAHLAGSPSGALPPFEREGRRSK